MQRIGKINTLIVKNAPIGAIIFIPLTTAVQFNLIEDKIILESVTLISADSATTV